MRFVNSIELLGLANKEVSSIDSAAIKKAKRVVLAEIELSDEHYIDYHGSTITNTDVERASTELIESSERIEFYHFIARYKELNDFLISGDIKLFDGYRQESIYKLQSFVEFISPFFSPQFEKILLKSYQGKNFSSFKKIISVIPPLSSTDLQNCYRTLTTHLKEQILEVTTLSASIKNEDSIYDENDIDEVEGWIKDKLDVKYFNVLPSFFQNTRNSAAQAIRNLSVDVFNAFNEAQLAIAILQYALSLSIDGLVSKNLNADLEQLSKINAERKEQSKVEPILQKYATLLITIRKYRDDVEKKLIYSTEVESWVNYNISISELNSLGKVFDEIRNQIALALRGLSVAVWNTYNSIDVAIVLINKANSITVTDAETKTNLKEARARLNTLKSEMPSSQPTRSTYTPASSTTPSSDNTTAWIVGCGILLFLIVVGIKSCNEPSYTPSTSYETPAVDTTAVTTEVEPSSTYSSPSSPSTNTYTYTPPTPVESPYKGNHLKNGNSPLDGCFGQGIYDTEAQAYITFKNSVSSDAVVCLVRLRDDRTIRNEYIRRGTNYTMSQIPTETYFLKVYYGNDWNPNLRNFCGTEGAFESSVNFSKSDEPKDYIEIHNGDRYTGGSITLYPVIGGNMSTESMSESDFFK